MRHQENEKKVVKLLSTVKILATQISSQYNKKDSPQDQKTFFRPFFRSQHEINKEILSSFKFHKNEPYEMMIKVY